MAIKYLIFHIVRGSSPRNNKNNILIFLTNARAKPTQALKYIIYFIISVGQTPQTPPNKILLIYVCKDLSHATLMIAF